MNKDKTSMNDLIDEVLRSSHFEAKILQWTRKTIKEVFLEYWKVFFVTASIFIAVIMILIKVIFNSFDTTIKEIEVTLNAVSRSTNSLEDTIHLLINNKINLDKPYDYKRRNSDG